MPELPEVETMRRGILGAVGGRISTVELLRCRLKPIRIRPRLASLRQRVAGRRIEAVDRRGKRVLVHLDQGDTIVFEPRMTGLVLIADSPDPKYSRLSLNLTGCDVEQITYWDRRGLGSVQLFSPRQLQLRLGPQRLGPDALTITPDLLRTRLAGSRREIKTALLDQRALAGIGNLYASELLHAAGVHPAHRCDRLSRDRWQQIHQAMVHVLEEAIRYEGSTLGDGTYRNALNNPGSYQSQHRVYDREGKICPACRREKIVRIVQAQRSTFFCPACQTRRRRS